jgi:nucleoside-diphosphate-sugar epimerase
MRVFLAGATGAIGRPLVARLLADGHTVIGTTRDEGRASALRAQGVEAVVLDALDLQALRDAVLAAEPEAVIHQLTALPAQADPKAMGPALELTNRLRRETVPLLLDAAREAGARRALVQSIAFVTRPDGVPIHDEDAPLYLDAPAEFRDNMVTVADLETACATATSEGLDTLVLRYGFYYGPNTWYAKDGTMGELIRKRRYPIIGGGEGRMSFVHIDDAVDATVRALTAGEAGIYNVTDDDPAQARDWLPVLAQQLGAKPPRKAPAWIARRLAGDAVVHYATTLPGNGNAKARGAFTGWAPRAWRDGFAEVFG